ncbi:MAG: hypothetical protein NC420_13185 [Eubacterium sp.]|nr:hypothetical protein [Eubacterium sp.]MCM1304314.1 hypothetical protein [Butyrivibrio sp.]MCM1344061.1 hypothetical protein [Muribaculaceae bacterium]MCM1409249.1 hypothetical protein [Lachnospiraceae bacterium]
MERKSLTLLKLGILFLFLDFRIGNLDLMPEFAGMLFLFASLASHTEQTETEKRLKPLLLILAADCFLHWVIRFEHPVESLLISALMVYVIFLLMGEVIKRIREDQPDRASHLNFARMGTVIFLTMNFLLAAYDNPVINGLLVGCSLAMLIFLMVVVCRIRPGETMV